MDTKTIVADTVYHALRESFLHSGKGRPKNLPSDITLNNRVLIQLYHLRQEGSKPKKVIDEWIARLDPRVTEMAASGGYFYNLVVAAEQKLQKLQPADVEGFLNLGIDLDFISETLSAFGVTRRTFAFPPTVTEPNLSPISNKFVLELDQFRISQGLLKKGTIQWITALSGVSDPSRINTAINALHKRYKKLLKKKSVDPTAFDNFISEEFQLSQQHKAGGNEKQELAARTCQNCSKLKQVLHGKENQAQNERDAVLSEVDMLKELLAQQEKNHCQEIEYLRLKQKNIESENLTLREEIERLKLKLKQTRSARSKAFKRVNTLNERCQVLSRKRKYEIDASKSTQDKLVADLGRKKRKIAQLKEETDRLTDSNNSLHDKLLNQQLMYDVKIKAGENNAYSNNVRQAAMLLQSEAGVSAANVKKVVNIVANKIFDHNITENLPSAQSCLNMNTEGLVISNIQVTEKVLASDNVTVHLDGTSRDHRKFISHQLTPKDGPTLYLGFTPVAVEDADTILDKTLSLFKGITQQYSEFSNEEIDEVFIKFLKKIRNTMTDRAATMKSFDKKFQEFLNSEIGEDVVVHFLHCNAHFLLGLSSACNKAFNIVETNIREETRQAIGRDKDAKFGNFSGESETCTSRLIRTLCDILGPRGDEKNGCRVDWKEFCPDSKIPSYKSNRFNCFFEAAAAIVHHYYKIKSFFTSGVLPEKPNKKIESVSLDVSDRSLMSCITALAFLYLKITGPYWKAVNSSMAYDKFSFCVQEMYNQFLKCSKDTSELLSPDYLGPFGSDFSMKLSPFFESVHTFLKSEFCDYSLVNKTLFALSEECAAGTVRQLNDFLNEGCFSHVNLDIADTLKSCPLTNLVGESSFGDLDYDISRRSHCSILKRSATHCIKRNKTASQYIDSKCKRDQDKLFSVARKGARELLEKSKIQQTEISVKLKEKMAANQQKALDKEVTTFLKRGELERNIEKWGGLCTTKDEVDSMLKRLEKGTKTTIINAIKDQIRYHKVFNNAKHLTIYGSLEELTDRLKNHLDSA